MAEENPVGLRAQVRGRVQGVGFRVFVLHRARELRLRGFVRNLRDETTVEVVAEGPRSALDTLLDALRIGPSAAYVERVDASWGEATSVYDGFALR